MKAWHFLADTGLMRNDESPPPDGEMLQWDGPVKLCQSGLHASECIIDALKYAPGSLVCRVELGRYESDHDKIVGRERTILWRADATRTLHEFSCWCAKQALALVPDPDPHVIAALEIKRSWLDGKATDAELSVARAAVWDAAGAAARDAAGAAARDAAWAASSAAARAASSAAAWAASRAAAWDAAWAASRDAARAAAWAASRAAAWDAARDAAWDAAWDAQNAKLTEMIEALK